jgi:hypothetical protein
MVLAAPGVSVNVYTFKRLEVGGYRNRGNKKKIVIFAAMILFVAEDA